MQLEETDPLKNNSAIPKKPQELGLEEQRKLPRPPYHNFLMYSNIEEVVIE